MRLEDRVTQGRIVYIARLVHDAEQGTLEFHLATDPEQPNVVRVLRFFQVEDFSQVWEDEPDPNLLEQILWMEDYARGDRREYEIRLGDSEITFLTAEEPSIEEVAGAAGPDA
jgi:hypothetical protein